MMGDLKIAFDFINSKEYVSKFTADEFTDIDKLPENLKDKKFYIFKNCEPHCQAIGTFLLDFMNTDFDDFEDLVILQSTSRVNCNIFITNDKKLLKLENFNNIKIQTVKG
mgnify:CR=1 FL=1